MTMEKGTRGTALERFYSKFTPEPNTGCWLWNTISAGGYGTFWDDSQKTVKAYKWSYEHFVGPVPSSLELDHLCRQRSCVNPSHLEPVTRKVNSHRGKNKGWNWTMDYKANVKMAALNVLKVLNEKG